MDSQGWYENGVAWGLMVILVILLLLLYIKLMDTTVWGRKTVCPREGRDNGL